MEKNLGASTTARAKDFFHKLCQVFKLRFNLKSRQSELQRLRVLA